MAVQSAITNRVHQNAYIFAPVGTAMFSSWQLLRTSGSWEQSGRDARGPQSRSQSVIYEVDVIFAGALHAGRKSDTRKALKPAAKPLGPGAEVISGVGETEPQNHAMRSPSPSPGCRERGSELLS